MDFILLTQVILLTTSTQEPATIFTISWEPKYARTDIVHYSVAITLAPPYGPTSTTNSSVSVSLQLDLLYNITIIQNACSQEHTSLFTLGKHLKYMKKFIIKNHTLGCSLLTSYAVHKFIIHINGTMTAHYLASNISEVITCANNMWGTDIEVTSTTEMGNSYTYYLLALCIYKQ